jgi:hypothetical protein
MGVPRMSLLFFSALALFAASHLKPSPNANTPVTINVDAAANRRGIDDRIYGVAFSDAGTIDDLSLPLNRWGGNTTSRYNWINSTANHARDYYFENIPDIPNGGANGASADQFIQLAHGPKTIMTIPVLGYLPSANQKGCAYSVAKYVAQGCCSGQAQSPPEPAGCGNGFSTAMGNPPLKHINDPLDVETLYTSAHQADWIQHMTDTFRSAAAGGVKYYAIDNEPDLWDSTHFDIHPDPSTYDEIGGKMLEYAPLIKSKDPSSLVMGPVLSGWMWYFDSASDWASGNHNDWMNHGMVYFVPWYLQQAQTYEQANGVRILDILSLHWYPQGLRTVPGGPITNQEFDPNNPADEVTTATKTLRNQSTRSLWDPNYVDQSWIHDLGYENNMPHLIPLMRLWVDTYYPGTQIGITEYNWGAENDPNGATAQAEILGIFGREGLNLATRWTSPPAGPPVSNVYNAYKMYRNYDGAHSKFGDLSVSSGQADADIDNVSSFAALRSSDGALTIMVMAKVLSGDTQVTIDLANFNPSGGAAHYWLLSSANAIAQQADVALAGASLTFTAHPETVNLFVIPSTLVPPANVNALATGTTVNVSWNAVAGAVGYKVYRATSINGPFNLVGNPAGTSYPDAGLGADTAYLYKVAAVNGTAISALSALDAATTTVFSDDPLNGGTAAKAAHITQLRTAVNAMRVAADIGVQSFSDTPLNAGTTIKAVHVTELRTALDQARAALGLPAIVYVDPAIAPHSTTIKAAHMIDLRNGVK